MSSASKKTRSSAKKTAHRNTLQRQHYRTKTTASKSARNAPAKVVKKTVTKSRTLASNAANSSNAGGSAGFRGYLYQVDVSVMTALDLMVAKGMASQIELEPCTQEDVEAVLDTPDPSRGAVAVNVANRHIVIQAKFSQTTEWSHTNINRLLAHGGPSCEASRGCCGTF